MNEEMIPESRKKFLIRLSLWIAAVPAALVSIPIVNAFLGPLIKKQKQEWKKIGNTSEIKIGETVLVTYVNADPLPWSGMNAKSAVWVRRKDETTFIAFSAHCTHLGCPVRWVEEAQLFMCPCHGGVYYKDGEVAAGPPPKPLVRFAVRLNNDAIEMRTAPVPITGMEYEKKG